MKKNKLNPEQRAEEVIGRFRDLELPIGYSDLIRCALELVNENIFISNREWGVGWQNRRIYWEKVKEFLEDKLK